MIIKNEVQTDWRALHGNSFQACRVLVTGGAGFIGSHLVEALVALGASVAVVDDLSGGALENLKAFSPIEYFNASILDVDTLRRVTRDRQYVFHLAALGSVPASVDQPRHYHEVNSLGTLNVLEAARDARVRRVIFAASSSCYGDNGVPWVETMPVRAHSPYAATKISGEAMLRAFSLSYGLDTVSLRYFNIFGPRQNANSAYAAVIAAFAKAVLAGKPPMIFGDGEQTRDFTYVHNAVHANLLAARNQKPLGGEAINVGCGESVTVRKLAELVLEFFGRRDLATIFAAERPGDLKHSYADLRLARSALGFEPIVRFEDGLRPTLEWYKAVLGSPS